MKKLVLLIVAVIFFGIFFGQKCSADVIYENGYENIEKEQEKISIFVYVVTQESLPSERKNNPHTMGQYIYTESDERTDVTGLSWGKIFEVGKKMYGIKEKGLILQKVSTTPDPGDRVVLYTFDFYYQ